MTKAAKKEENLSLERVEQIIAPAYQYDADAEQLIPLEIRGHRIVHRLRPLTNERFFQLEKERLDVQKRIAKSQNITTQIYAPNESLWNDLALEVIGFKPDPDWKIKTYFLDKTAAVGALLHTEIKEEAENAEEDELLTFDIEIPVKMDVLQSGTLIETVHIFRQETKAEMDEYLAIMTDKPKAQGFARFAHDTSAERLCDLYDATNKTAMPYAGRIPVWHKAAAVQTHFARQFLRMGK